MEGKSLLEMITGKIYEDVVTKSTVPNAVTLYEKLSLLLPLPLIVPVDG